MMRRTCRRLDVEDGGDRCCCCYCCWCHWYYWCCYGNGCRSCRWLESCGCLTRGATRAQGTLQRARSALVGALVPYPRFERSFLATTAALLLYRACGSIPQLIFYVRGVNPGVGLVQGGSAGDTACCRCRIRLVHAIMPTRSTCCSPFSFPLSRATDHDRERQQRGSSAAAAAAASNMTTRATVTRLGSTIHYNLMG